MRLAIEAFGVRHGGGLTVLTELLAAAEGDARFSRILLYRSSGCDSTGPPAASKTDLIACRAADAGRLYRGWWLEHRLGAELRRRGADVFLSLSGAGLAGTLPQVTYIQQSLPFSKEALACFTPGVRLRLGLIRSAMRRSCRASRRVVVQTETMKRLVDNAFSLPPGRTEVITPAVTLFSGDAPFSPALAPMNEAQGGFRLLYVGSPEKYKNVDILLRAAEILRSSYPGLSVCLTWSADHPVQSRPGVHCLGYLDTAELAQAYRLADVLVMPSRQETVGLPLLEAMSLGVPIAAADRPYAREICRDAALFFDPDNVGELVSRLRSLIEDAALRDRLARRGRAISLESLSGRPWQRFLDVIADSGA